MGTKHDQQLNNPISLTISVQQYLKLLIAFIATPTECDEPAVVAVLHSLADSQTGLKHFTIRDSSSCRTFSAGTSTTQLFLTKSDIIVHIRPRSAPPQPQVVVRDVLLCLVT